MQFIFTSPTFATDKAEKSKREFYIPRFTRERNLYGTEFEIRLRNELTQRAIAKECADWIRKKAIFKSNTTNQVAGFMGGKVWSMGFNFQRDAALAIINKLEKHNGCILADSVALGKTFTALAVIKYYESRTKNVHVLCPKKLSNDWNTYRDNYIINPLAEDRLLLMPIQIKTPPKQFACPGGVSFKFLSLLRQCHKLNDNAAIGSGGFCMDQKSPVASFRIFSEPKCSAP